MATWVCATCGPVPAGEIRHLDHDSPHGHERHECGSSAGLDWTTKEHDMNAEPIAPERIAELVDSINEQFTNPQDGHDWGGWFESQPESDWERTANAAPGELVLTDGSAIVYDPAKHAWGHVPADQYELPPIDSDEPAAH